MSEICNRCHGEFLEGKVSASTGMCVDCEINKANEKTIDNSDPAFPRAIHDGYDTVNERLCSQNGMTIRQYAAIKLQVPDSGVDWLDDMIVKSNRDRLAGMALQGALSNANVLSAIARICGDFAFNTARYAYENADAMLKAREVKP